MEDEKEEIRPENISIETIEAVTAYPEPRVGGPVAKGLRRLFASLLSRDFRYFFMGAVLSNIGTWVQTVALGWLVYQITKSSFHLGFINFIGSLPVLIFALFAGAIADRLNRKMLVLWTQVILMAFAFVLAALSSLELATVFNIAVISFFSGIAMAFSFPAWQAMISDIVPKKDLLNAIALNSAQFNTARLLGPSVAAVLMGALGIAACFYANAISYLAVIAALILIRGNFEPHESNGEKILSHALGGIKYAREHRTIAFLLFSMAVLIIFGMPFAVLMPVFAAEILDVGARGMGFLLAANGFGALLGSLNVAYVSSGGKKNGLIGPGLFIFGLALSAFSFSKSYDLSMIMMVISGAAFSTVASSINNALQSSVPNEVRGRVMGIFVWIFLGFMPVGSLIFGSLAELIGVQTAVFVGAVSCLIMAQVLILEPKLIMEA